MTLVSWSPFREFDDLFSRYNRLGGARVLPGDSKQGQTIADWRPAADISETSKEYLIKAELPAVKKEEVDVSVHDGVITIKGERRIETSNDDEKQHRVESFRGNFSRSFSLPADVDESAISAESKDGVLQVHLPKTEVKQPKPIEIKVS
jgi:HSP20 family protein